MTCSFQDSISHTSGSRQSGLQNARSECLRRDNCTAVRTNYCNFAFSSSIDDDIDIHYDFCNDDPVPINELTKGFQSDEVTICVFKKGNPDGKFYLVC